MTAVEFIMTIDVFDEQLLIEAARKHLPGADITDTNDAWIAQAKDVKRRAATGEAYQWEIDRIPTLVIYARSDMHRSLFFRSLKNERGRQ